MGIFRQFPYSNFHEMNMDWIMEEIKKLQKQCTYIINNDGSTAIVNVANYTPEGELTSDNINDAVTEALNVSKYLYIPAGEYQCNLIFQQDVVLYLDRDCKFKTLDGNDPGVIDAYNCSIEIYGGEFTCGDDDGSKVPEWTGSYLAKHGVIRLYNCHDVNIKGVNFPHAKSGNCILLETCRDVIIQNCQFHKYLECGVRIVYECRNITVDSCIFTDIRYAINRQYCYAVATGGYDLGDVFTPPDNIVYSNNFVYDSEDCALDTHGATNVIIRNNKIIDTVNAITAYNDDNRVERPAGWVMTNVLIENNFCSTSKDIDPNSQYPHQFVMLGSFNEHASTEAGWSSRYGKYDNYTNCVFRNNFLQSPNTSASGKLFLGYIGRNYLIENNIIDCMNAGAPITGRRIIGLTLKNNTIKNRNGDVIFWDCCGEIRDNVGAKFNYATSHPSQFTGIIGDYGQIRSFGLVRCGDLCRDGSDNMSVVTSYGTALRPGITHATINVTVADGIATADAPFTALVPNSAIQLGSSINAYVVDVIDVLRFKVLTTAGAAVADGTYTLTYKTATLTAV